MSFSIALRAVPYLVLLALGLTEFPSSVLNKRYQDDVTSEQRAFARRWNSAAEVLSLPLVSMSYAIAGIGSAIIEGEEPWALVVLLIGVLALVGLLIVGSLKILADRLDKVTGDSTKLDRTLCLFKIGGILLAAGLDLGVRFHAS